MKQVHGDRVVQAGAEEEPCADGQWTERPGEVLVVGVADCVPVFLWDARHRRIALVHAGWRGTAAGVVGRAIAGLRAAGSQSSDLWMAMGPSIAACCYEVGPEVAGRFAAEVLRREAGGARLDLRAANRLQVRACGVPEAQILSDPPCSACRSDLFFSHRKSGPRTGRQWALAWIATPSGRPQPPGSAGRSSR
jgi:hypothetical protein